MDYEALETSGLILAGRVARLTGETSALSRDERRGLLVALRRGTYVRREIWDAANDRQRHILRVKGVVAAADEPVVVAGVSAAALWGMPISASLPVDVILLQERRGGGRKEPGVRRTSVGSATAQSQLVTGIAATSLARTALDIARTTQFSEAIGSLDWVLWRRNEARISQHAVWAELELLRGARGFRRMERIVRFSTDLSDSFGESRARAVIHLLGFDAPRLQVEFRDREGPMYPDFYWASTNVAVEFDGKQKYTRDKYTDGDPSEIVWREKKREDRLRRQVRGMERILTSDVMHPERVERLLVELGVPRPTQSGRSNPVWAAK